MITISLLEDNPILRHRFQSMVEDWENVAACFAFENNQEFIKHSVHHCYDVALIDLDLPDGSGLKSIKYLANSQPAVCIIVISALSDAGSIYTAIESGAVGYIHKDDNSMTLQSSIRMALRGESPISPMIARRIFSNIKNSSKDLLGEGESKKSIASDILTDRELQVLHVISKGLSYSEAASALEISHKTVPTHIRNIYRKLQVNNRSEAVYEARQMGILK